MLSFRQVVLAFSFCKVTCYWWWMECYVNDGYLISFFIHVILWYGLKSLHFQHYISSTLLHSCYFMFMGWNIYITSTSFWAVSFCYHSASFSCPFFFCKVLCHDDEWDAMLMVFTLWALHSWVYGLNLHITSTSFQAISVSVLGLKHSFRTPKTLLKHFKHT